jgi:hypothetical protein
MLESGTLPECVHGAKSETNNVIKLLTLVFFPYPRFIFVEIYQEYNLDSCQLPAVLSFVILFSRYKHLEYLDTGCYSLVRNLRN